MSDFDVKRIVGLSEQEAASRLISEGYNEIQSGQRRNFFSVVWGVVREPMFLLLLAAGVIYLFLGDLSEALMLLSFVIVVILITVYQEHKTEKAIEALKDLSSPRALVIRDGAQRRIAGRQVVRGDIIVLHEGDRVPADARLLWCVNLSIDESLLTGESVSVRKSADGRDQAAGRPGGDDQPFVYASTLIVQGQGVAEVTSTGIRTEVGKIGRALESLESEETLLQKEIRRLVRNVAFLGVGFCCCVLFLYGENLLHKRKTVALRIRFDAIQNSNIGGPAFHDRALKTMLRPGDKIHDGKIGAA